MKTIFTLLAGILLMGSCRTKDKEVAGKGGAATLNLFPQHHEVARNLINFKVYIKYGTKDVPTSGVYDDSAICTNHDNLVSAAFSGLKNGDYYIYASGFDTSVNSNLHGGAPYTITQQTSQNVNVAVSE